MSKKKLRIPSLRLHKATNQGFVELGGRRYYLGVWGRPGTEEAYRRKIAQWVDSNGHLPEHPTRLTIAQLCGAYSHHCHSYYIRPDGTPSHEIQAVNSALRVLRELYGTTRAERFGKRGGMRRGCGSVGEGAERGWRLHFRSGHLLYTNG